MTDSEKKPLLPLLSSVLAEHVREFSEQARNELGSGLAQLRQELGARHFDERLKEFATEARQQFREGVDQFRRELERDLEELRARRHSETAEAPVESEQSTSDETSSAPAADDAETKPMPRVRVVDPRNDE